MKVTLRYLLPLALCGGGLHAQTIEWGSEFGTVFETSEGSTLDNTFLFQLGAFDSPFTPTADNADDWLGNWRIFDTGNYNPSLGIVTSSASMNTNGGSESPTGNASFDFQGLQGYVWIRNEDLPGPTTEWFIVSDPSWSFPTAVTDCCNIAPPLQWAIEGDVITVAVPEPSGALLAMLAAATGLIRRRR